MFPVGTVHIGAGQTKNIDLGIAPIGEFNSRGAYSFTYFIRDVINGGEQEQTLSFRIIDLKDAFEIGSGELDPEANSIEIYVRNRANTDFENIKAEFSSPFFEFEETFDLKKEEIKTFEIELDRDKFKQLTAGFYTLNAEISVEGKSADVEGTIKFLEKDLLTTTQKDYGFVIYTKIIEKINEGNIPVHSETSVEKNIFSRLFTSFSPEPDFVEREGFKVTYTWVRDLNPGQNLKITTTTNWLFPLLVIFFVVVIVFFARKYSRNNLGLRKKITFVKAKGGEFALKVTIFVKARKYIERVSITDRLPPLVKLYEKFGQEQPTKADAKSGKISWNFEKFEEGETRVLSYFVYSKVGVLGKFALPSAYGVYERDGKIKETSSNRAFFVADQKIEKEKDL
jgi:hypothetical protein